MTAEHSVITCPHGETFWLLGETPEARRTALEEWPGCACEERAS